MIINRINSVTMIQKTGPRAAHTGGGHCGPGLQRCCDHAVPWEVGPSFSLCSLEVLGRLESEGPHPSSHATLDAPLLAMLCSKVEVWAPGTAPFMVTIPLAFGGPGGQCCGGRLPDIIRGLSVCLSTAGAGWLEARVTDEEDVFRRAGDLT